MYRKEFFFVWMLVSIMSMDLLAETQYDTLTKVAFLENRIKIQDGEGELYEFAQNQDGYKYIYYLFTECDYIQLDSTDIIDDSSYYCLYNEKSQANWYNYETGRTAPSSVRWTMRYKGNTSKDVDCVENNPHRCLKREHGAGSIVLLFNTDCGGQKREDCSTVMLVVMQPFQDKADNYTIQDSLISCRNVEWGSVMDLCNKKSFTKEDSVLSNVEYRINLSDRVVVDSVLVNGVDVPFEGGLFAESVIASLNNIPIEYDNDVSVIVYYRYFGYNGEVKSLTATKTLPLQWENAVPPLWAVILIVFCIMIFIIALATLINYALNKFKIINKPKKSEQQV